MLKDAVLSPSSRNDSGRCGENRSTTVERNLRKSYILAIPLHVGVEQFRHWSMLPPDPLPTSSLLIMCTIVHVHRPEGLSAACWQWDIFQTPLYKRPINLHFSCRKVLGNLLFSSAVLLPYVCVCMYVHADCCTTGASFYIIRMCFFKFVDPAA